jgi:hypothetical protein
MAAYVTSVAYPDTGIPGMLADSDPATRTEGRCSREASAETRFGIMVARDATYKDDGCVLLNTSAASMEQLLAGIVVFRQDLSKPDELGDTGIKPGMNVRLLRLGHILVMPEQTVNVGDAVRVRAVAIGNEVAGAFRKDADGTDCIDISKFARWVRGGSTAVPAVLEIDMVGAGNALADT